MWKPQLLCNHPVIAPVVLLVHYPARVWVQLCVGPLASVGEDVERECCRSFSLMEAKDPSFALISGIFPFLSPNLTW